MRIALAWPLVVLMASGLSGCSALAALMEPQPRTHDIALADLDGDGDLDAVLANDKSEGTAPDTVWWNDGAGLFADSGLRLNPIPGNYHVTTGDFNRDGKVDVLFGAFGSGWLVLNYGSGRLLGGGTSLQRGDILTGPVDMGVGDLDGDGDLDVLLAVCCGTMIYGSGRTVTYMAPSQQVWLNDGAGRFRDTGQVLGDLGTRAVALGDLDGDGDLDAFMGNANSFRDAQGNMSQNEPNTIWLNDGTGHFDDSRQRLGSADTQAVALGDLDGDGDLDAYVANGGPDEVWLNDAFGSFTDSGQALAQVRTLRVALGDVDGDGDLDALQDADSRSQVWLNDGSGQLTDSRQGLSHGSDCAGTLGDVDDDGDLDLVAGCLDREVVVRLNDGQGGFE